MFYTNINKFNILALPIALLGFLNSAAFGIDSTTDASANSNKCCIPNLLPQNIRKGVTILGVVGTFSGETSLASSSPSASSNCDKDKENGTPSSSKLNCCKLNCCSKNNVRYRDNRNGTVKDMCTGLIWLKNANCFGMLEWKEAQEKVAHFASEQYWIEEAKKKANKLASEQSWKTVEEKADEDGKEKANKLDIPQCELTDESKKGSWRLPTIEEWQAMVDKKYSWPGPSLSNAAGTGQWTEGDMFSNVQTNLYWSNTTYTKLSSAAWCMYLSNNTINYYFKGGTYYVWPVREEMEEKEEISEF
jgi:hypothetical protein